MKIRSFARRNAREILRDPLSTIFSLGFPVVLLVLLTAIQANIPAEIFTMTQLAPGVAVFGLAFLTLFSATLIARDRETALLQRLYTTPMTALDFILGYTLPILPMALAQGAVCFGLALALGLPFSSSVIGALFMLLPVSALYIGLGLLCGSVLSTRQVGGICGALLTNLSAWLSGVWFDVDLVGGAFKAIADALPFLHAVELERAVLNGPADQILPHLLIVGIYAVIIFAAAVGLFLRQMKRQ